MFWDAIWLLLPTKKEIMTEPVQDIYIGEKQFPNPTNVKVSKDTDQDQTPTKLSGGAKLGWTAPSKMDISNPAKADFLPSAHPLEEHIGSSKMQGRGYRHQIGPQSIKVSDN